MGGGHDDPIHTYLSSGAALGLFAKVLFSTIATFTAAAMYHGQWWWCVTPRDPRHVPSTPCRLFPPLSYLLYLGHFYSLYLLGAIIIIIKLWFPIPFQYFLCRKHPAARGSDSLPL